MGRWFSFEEDHGIWGGGGGGGVSVGEVNFAS